MPGGLTNMPSVYGIEYQTDNFQEREVVARNTASISASSEEDDIHDKEQKRTDFSNEYQVSAEVVQIEDQRRKSAINRSVVDSPKVNNNNYPDTNNDIINKETESANGPSSTLKSQSGTSEISDDSSSDSQESDPYESGTGNVKTFNRSNNIPNVSSVPRNLGATITTNNSSSAYARDPSLSDIGVVVQGDDSEDDDASDELKSSHSTKSAMNDNHKQNEKNMENNTGSNDLERNNIDHNSVGSNSRYNGSHNIRNENEDKASPNKFKEFDDKDSQFSAKVKKNFKQTEIPSPIDNYAAAVDGKSEGKILANGSNLNRDKFEIPLSNNSSVNDMTKYATKSEFNGSRENSFDIDPNIGITLQVDNNIDSYSSSDSNNWEKSPTQLLRENNIDQGNNAESYPVKLHQSMSEEYVQDNEENFEDVEYLDDDCV